MYIYQRRDFKQRLTSANSEFSFSQTGCLTNAKELSLHGE